MTSFGLLGSADLLVPDAQAAFEALAPIVGLYEPRGVFRQEWPHWGFDARWCRVNLDVAMAPTHIEIIAPLGTPDPTLSHPFMAEILGAQRSRAYRTHSTPVEIDDLDGMCERLSSTGARFRVDEPAGELPFRRLWLGRDHEDPGRYVPTTDGGLYLEFVPSFGFPVPGPDHVPKPLRPGHPVSRVVRRTMLVEDLGETLHTLERHTGWEPERVTETPHARVARLGFAHPRSAVLEVVEPTDADTRYGRYFGEWGFGPVAITFEVESLDAARDQLESAGVAAEREGDLLVVDPARTWGAHFEFCAKGWLQ